MIRDNLNTRLYEYTFYVLPTGARGKKNTKENSLQCLNLIGLP
jgi:hypothetical protein